MIRVILAAVLAVIVGIITFAWWRRTRAQDTTLADQAAELGKLKGKVAADAVSDAGVTAEEKLKATHAKLDEEAKHALDSGSLADDIAKLGGK